MNQDRAPWSFFPALRVNPHWSQQLKKFLLVCLASIGLAVLAVVLELLEWEALALAAGVAFSLLLAKAVSIALALIVKR